MALIEKRRLATGKVTYRARVKFRGRTLTSTHHTRASAERWAAEASLRIRDSAHFIEETNRQRPLKDLIMRYTTHVMPLKKNPANQKAHLRWWSQRIGDEPVEAVTRSLVALCRDELLAPTASGRRRGPATVVRYLASLSHVFSVAITDWEWASQNPVLGIRKPKEPRGRERYLSEHELQKLLSACQASSSSHLHDVVVVALCSAMRRGEIVGLRWPMVDFTRGFIRLSLTKNGTSRSVPLVEPALGLLAARHKVRRIDTDRVFPAASGDGEWDLKKAWTTALRKAEIDDFKFHDLRHTAASYLAMNGATTVQLAAILGHKTLAMVRRYAHLSDTHNAAVVESMAKRMFTAPQGEVRHG